MEFKFTKEIKKKWLDALKSGDYKRGTSVLKRERDGKVKHCCLGVLCDVHPRLGFVMSDGSSSHPTVDGNEKDEDNKMGFGYSPFEAMFGDTTEKLWRANDGTEEDQDETYVAVIHLIEDIPTVD